MGKRRAHGWHTGGRVDAHLADNRRESSSRHPIVNQIREEFDLTTPGVGEGLIRLKHMQTEGEAITLDVARAVLGTFVQYHARLAREEEERKLRTVVYYMRLGDMVKIGWTTNLPARIHSINPQELMATEKGDAKLERQRHKQFADLRIHGEWFRMEEPLVGWIDELKATYDEGVTTD